MAAMKILSGVIGLVFGFMLGVIWFTNVMLPETIQIVRRFDTYLVLNVWDHKEGVWHQYDVIYKKKVAESHLETVYDY